MAQLKISIIGAGSTYTPELIEGIIQRYENLPVTDITLMDINENKLKIVGDLCSRMFLSVGIKLKLILTQNLTEALENSNFVLTQIRVGQLSSRVLDEKIPLKYGLIGQETTGIGGFFKALRTVPVIMHIAKQMEELCPEAWLINFSNPSGIIAEALQNYSSIKSIGLCNVPINMIIGVQESLKEKELDIQYVGLNHLSFITGIWKKDVDLLSIALEQGLNGPGMKNIPMKGFNAELIQSIGAIPSPYLEYFYYKTDKLSHLLKEEKSRGEVCMDIEERLLHLYQDTSLEKKPEELEKRGGAKYSEAAISLVDSIYNDKKEKHVINIRNQGALDFMADNDVVEITAVIGKDGVRPVPIKSFGNEHVKELMQTVKAYERHTVQAALKGDEKEAMHALLIHPLIGDYNQAVACFAEMKEANREYLTQFKY